MTNDQIAMTNYDTPCCFWSFVLGDLPVPDGKSNHPNADVRMRGFAERITVAEALAWLDAELDKLGVLGSETIALNQAIGRVLATEIVSEVNVPNFQRAMMDGYALRAADIAEASADQPMPLHVVADCTPGDFFEDEIQPGEAIRIMTGAALPAGVDSVLPVEHTSVVDEQVFAMRSLDLGKNLGSVGEDVKTGDTLLPKGRVLRPQDIGVLSSVGHAQLEVVRRPRVRIVVTGNELLPSGEKPQGHSIVDANGPMLQTLVTRDGGIPNHPGIVADDRDAILAALEDDADVVLTSGGSSVGQEDHVPTLLAEHGELAIHGVAMRPAAPLGVGTLNGRLVVLLPGNPVACLWGYDLIAGRAVRSLGGRTKDWPYHSTTKTLTREIKSPVGRLDYVRVTIDGENVEPVKSSGASVLSSTTKADGFLVVPTESSGFGKHAQVKVCLYD